MADDDPLVRLHEVLAVLTHLAPCGAAVIELEYLGGDPFGIEPVAERVGAKRGDDGGAGIHGLSALRGDDPVTEGAEQSDAEPDGEGDGFFHA